MAPIAILPTADEKRPTKSSPCQQQHRVLLFFAFLALISYGVFKVVNCSSYIDRWVDPVRAKNAPSVIIGSDKDLVPLEAHIMSKCPDAKDCLKELVLPAMMRINEKVNFTLSYIGTPTENDGVECKHGPGECMGNILELCAAHLYPDPKINLGFTMCLTRDYEDIPQRSLVEDCALEHAIDFEKLNDCAARDDGAFGLQLLRESVQRTRDVSCFEEFQVRRPLRTKD